MWRLRMEIQRFRQTGGKTIVEALMTFNETNVHRFDEPFR